MILHKPKCKCNNLWFLSLFSSNKGQTFSTFWDTLICDCGTCRNNWMCAFSKHFYETQVTSLHLSKVTAAAPSRSLCPALLQCGSLLSSCGTYCLGASTSSLLLCISLCMRCPIKGKLSIVRDSALYWLSISNWLSWNSFHCSLWYILCPLSGTFNQQRPHTWPTTLTSAPAPWGWPCWNAIPWVPLASYKLTTQSAPKPRPISSNLFSHILWSLSLCSR